jgi:hypothetical protein
LYHCPKDYSKPYSDLLDPTVSKMDTTNPNVMPALEF